MTFVIIIGKIEFSDLGSLTHNAVAILPVRPSVHQAGVLLSKYEYNSLSYP